MLSIRKGNHGRIFFYLQLLREATQLGYQANRFRVALTDLEQGRRGLALIEKVLLRLRVNYPGVLCELDSDRETGRGYKAVDPKRQAVWQLPDLYEFLCQWAYDIYDQVEYPALGQSPREAWAVGLTYGGEREHEHGDTHMLRHKEVRHA